MADISEKWPISYTSSWKYTVELWKEKKKEKMTERGYLVWGKLKGYSWWPAIVLSSNDICKPKKDPNKIWLFWFGYHTVSELDKENICEFTKNFTKFFTKNKRRNFVKATIEAINVLATENKRNLDDPASLLQWARNGFQCLWRQDCWTKQALPKFIEDSLTKYKGIVAVINHDVTDVVLPDVNMGEKALKDICLACSKRNVLLVKPHPLFIGNICVDCEKEVERVCRLSSELLHNSCIVCGQGGTIVYCCNEKCSKGYCQLCIEYLHSVDTFNKIVEDDNWQCYLCSNKNVKCLIMPRVKYQAPPPSNYHQTLIDLFTPSITPAQNHNSLTKVPTGDNIKKSQEKSLEEICIACGKDTFNLVEPHPLFSGLVCTACRKDVLRVCRYLPGKMRNYCIVCGQGGTLLYCSIKSCSRAFCKECIFYLDSKKAFKKILADDNWNCYLCLNKPNCFIKPRVCNEVSLCSVDQAVVSVPRPQAVVSVPHPQAVVSVPRLSPEEIQKQMQEEVQRVVQKVLNEEQSLEEICIACCKETFPLVKDHPLFLGKICRACRKDVNRVCKFPSGKSQRYCIVCGQGGTLVYCDNNWCQRAFCEECVTFLDSSEAFVQIVEAEEWGCYLCKPVLSDSCLIRSRVLDDTSEEEEEEVYEQTSQGFSTNQSSMFESYDDSNQELYESSVPEDDSIPQPPESDEDSIFDQGSIQEHSISDDENIVHSDDGCSDHEHPISDDGCSDHEHPISDESPSYEHSNYDDSSPHEDSESNESCQQESEGALYQSNQCFRNNNLMLHTFTNYTATCTKFIQSSDQTVEEVISKSCTTYRPF